MVRAPAPRTDQVISVWYDFSAPRMCCFSEVQVQCAGSPSGSERRGARWRPRRLYSQPHRRRCPVYSLARPWRFLKHLSCEVGVSGEDPVPVVRKLVSLLFPPRAGVASSLSIGTARNPGSCRPLRPHSGRRSTLVYLFLSSYEQTCLSD